MHSDEQEQDQRLIASIAAGDKAAFTAIYRRYLPVVLRWCLQETHNREVAADLSSEVFAVLLTMAHRYRPERGAVLSWLLGIARNKLRESRRRGRVEDSARRRLGIARLEITDEDLEQVDELAGREQEIHELLAGLPARQREALLGRVVDERSYAEIAAKLECSEELVRQRVSRGMRTLRAQMEDR